MEETQAELIHTDENGKTWQIPLKSVEIEAKVFNFAAVIEVDQIFFNPFPNPIEAVYNFPVEHGSGLVFFEAFIGDRRIQTQVKEKTKAQDEYEQGMKRGQAGVLLEEVKHDVVQVKVGQLQPGEVAKICLR